MNERRLRLAIGVLAVSVLLTACSLSSLFFPPVDFSNPGFSFGPGSSEFTPGVLGHGTATIEITSGVRQTIELTHLSGDQPSMVMPGFGAVVSWRGGDWALRVEGGGSEGSGLGGPGLTIYREDTYLPLQADGMPCTITFTAMTPGHVAGHAECKGLAWVGTLGGNPMDLPVPSGSPAADHPLFDATIVFDATP